MFQISSCPFSVVDKHMKNNSIERMIYKLQLGNRMWFSVVCTLQRYDGTSHHSGQNVVDTRGVECLRRDG